jgi:hypothetical protein
VQPLILIGYWRSENDTSWPEPAAFVDRDWDKTERGLVASYLSAATVVVTYMGYSHCRLCSKKDNGDSELTDGVYIWPDGLKHYVTEHNVRLPRRFVEHVLDRLAKFDLGPLNYDTGWWQKVKLGD